MLSLIKQEFVVLLSFSQSLARIAKVSNRTKYLVLNDVTYLVRPILIDMNPVELKYYTFIISLNKRTGSFNVLSPKICVPKETKDIDVKAFNLIINKNETKIMTEHVSCDYKCKFNSTTCDS